MMFLTIAALVLLGWIWPLVTGFVKRRRGEKCTAWLVIGGVWCAGALAVSCLIGLSIFAFVKMSSQWETNEFDLATYDGATATIVASYKGESSLTANTADQESFGFKSTDGTFIVPVGELTPTAYAISKKDAKGGDWHANWWFYSEKMEPFDLAEGATAMFERGPPFTMRAKRTNLTGGMQKLDVKIVDRTGAEVRIRAKQSPAIQIINEAGEVAWSKSLEYG